jgi:hypothetical protein
MEECVICLSEITSTENITTLGCCKKQMHAACYAQCLVNKPECPLCRTEHVAINIPTPEQGVRVITVVRDLSPRTVRIFTGLYFVLLMLYLYPPHPQP